MAVKSTCVRCYSYRIEHDDGTSTRVVDVIWRDLGRPYVLQFEQLIFPPKPLEFVPVQVSLVEV